MLREKRKNVSCVLIKKERVVYWKKREKIEAEGAEEKLKRNQR